MFRIIPVVQGGTLGSCPHASRPMNLSCILFLTVTFPFVGLSADPLLSASASTTSSAQPALAKIALGDVLARTSERNPELLALGLGRQVADGRVDQAGLRPNPTLSLALEDFGGTGQKRGADAMEVTVQASQLIERGDKPARRVVFAEREREVTQASFLLRRSEVLASSANAFAKVVAEKARLSLAGEQLALATEMLASANRRFQVSAASASEVARARAAQASAQAEFRRAQASAASALSALAVSWGGTAAEIGEIKAELRLPEAPPSLDQFQSVLAVSGNPRLGLFSTIISGQRAALELETARGVADVTLGAGVRRLNEGPATAFIVGFSMPLTFRDDNSGNIRAAHAQVRSAEQSLRAAETEQRAALAAAHAEMVAAHALATALRREALPAAEEASVSVRSAFERGVLPLIDVLDARRALIAIRREISDAEFAYATALVRAEALTGASFTETKALFERP